MLTTSYKNLRLILVISLIFFTYFFCVYYILSIERTDSVKPHQELVYTSLFEFIITAVNKLPFDNEHQIVELSEKQLNHHHIKYSVDKLPTSKNIFNAKSLDQLHAYLSHNVSQQLSYKLPNGLWLNYINDIHKSRFGELFGFFLITLFCILLAIIYGWIVLHFNVPLGRLKKSATQLKSDINAELNMGPGPNNLRAAENALHQMQSRLRELIDSRTKLLASISHDLRTPLTRAKLKTYFLEDKTVSEKINNDLTEMENMINATLNFAKNDFLQESKRHLDITSLLITVCHEFIDAGKLVHVDESFSSIHYFGAKYALKRCFSNIIDNAIKYANEVWVGIKVKNNRIIITFVDRGCGVPEPQLNLVLKPFYRLYGKNITKPGSGLGLTIVNEIIQQHEGTLELANRRRGGLLVTITLPLPP